MAPIRGVLLVLALICLGVLWATFFHQYERLRHNTRDVQLYFWALTLAITLLVIIRVWDAYHDNRKY